MPLSNDSKCALVFDLTYDTLLASYIPNAFIVEYAEGVLYYVKKSANSKTIEEFQLELDSNEKQLLTLCEKLNTKSLLSKYKIKNKIAKSLEIVLSDDKTAKIISHYINFTLESFFKIATKTTIPLSIDLNKKDVFHKQQVRFSNILLEPNLHFSKTPENIVYCLSLLNNKTEVFPFENDFKIILNNPSWVCLNKVLYPINHINGNKLKPFITKKNIVIPNKNSVEYFNKFIKNVIRKVPIAAEGFSVATNSNCIGCYIRPSLYIHHKIYLLEVVFRYNDYEFSITDEKEKHISLSHNEKDEFTVYQTIRNREEESKIIAILENLGFIFLPGGLATFNSNLSEIDDYFNITELLKLQDKIATTSIAIALELNNKTISKHTSTISTKFEEKKDWFDVEMIIEIEDFKIPFSNIISHLKTGNRLYELPNEKLFIIPVEWFSKYKSLVDFGKTSNNSIQIQKNQFTVLEESGIAIENKLFQKEIIPYRTTGNINAKLRNYQEEGVNWLVKNYQLGLGSCLADDMGLGKTIQSLAYLDFVYTHFEDDFIVAEEVADTFDLFSTNTPTTTKKLKALVVAPSSLTYNWFNETKKFAPQFTRLNYTGLDRKIKRKKLDKVDLVFTSYGLLLKDINLLKTIPFNFLIIDESQQIKNRNSKIYKAINTINATHKVSLSGTPIENSLSDLWSQMQFINPNLLNTYAFFESYFKKPIEKLFDEQKTKELRSLINPYLLRRTKNEVAKDLPEISEQIFYSEMSEEQSKFYENEKSIIRNYLIDKKLNTLDEKPTSNISILNALSKLRQLANHPALIGETMESGKFTDVSAYIETLLQAKQKVLIFSSYTSHLKIYTDWCDKNNTPYSLLTGSTKIADRESEVANFQKDDNKLLFFISLKAGGTGLNLTKASYVILLDPWWNPFAELQAIGRAHRIGQENQVNVVRFIAKDTIEEKISQLQQSKKEISDAIIETSVPKEVLNNIDYILA